MKILAIGAHHDDIEISCGGTIAKAVRNGDEVKMVVMSSSVYTDYKGKVHRTKEEVERENKMAVEILGVKEVVSLDFPTKDIPYNSTSIEALNSVIDEFEPDMILTHWCHDTHPAHKNTSLATISAARYYNSILMYEPMMPSGRSYQGFRPQVYVDITDFDDIKRKALMAHESQYKKYKKDLWVNAVEARARYRGYEMSSKYAECYEIVRMEWKL